MNCRVSSVLIDEKVEKFDREKYYFGCDWVQGWCDFYDLAEFFKGLSEVDERLKFDNFVDFNSGFLFYKRRFGWQGKSTINIAYNQQSEDDVFSVLSDENKARGIFLSVSGDGIRELGEDSFHKLLHYLYDRKFVCTRIDICCDIYNRDNVVVPLLLKAFKSVPKERYDLGIRSRLPKSSKKFYINYDFVRGDGSEFTENLTFGSRGSKAGYFKLYDKYLECYSVKRLKPIAEQLTAHCPDDYWYRMEYTLYQRNAEELFAYIINGISPGSAFKIAADMLFTPGEAYNFYTCGVHYNDLPEWEEFLLLCDENDPEFVGNVKNYVAKCIHFV